MNAKLFAILTAHPEKFPRSLSKSYPRILEKISTAWESEDLDALFTELLVADHEKRQGFPPEVTREILALNTLYEKYKHEEPPEDDPWAAEREMGAEEREIFVSNSAALGKPFTPDVLFQAVETGETRLAFDFVRAGMAVDVRRADDWTPLMVALFNGQEETAMMLLSRGANVNAKAKRGYEPIHWAALNGYVRALKFIVDKGGNVNAETDYGWTPLLQAASRGHLEIAKILIAKGARVNASEHEGWSPLHKACANAHIEMAKYLVHAGADARQRSASGLTPLELAMKTKNFALLEAISEPRAAGF